MHVWERHHHVESEPAFIHNHDLHLDQGQWFFVGSVLGSSVGAGAWRGGRRKSRAPPEAGQAPAACIECMHPMFGILGRHAGEPLNAASVEEARPYGLSSRQRLVGASSFKGLPCSIAIKALCITLESNPGHTDGSKNHATRPQVRPPPHMSVK